MKTVQGVVKDGRIDLSEPIVWPEGTLVRVLPVFPGNGRSDVEMNDLGAGEDEQADDAESIARWIAEFDAIPPLEMPPAEEAEWQAARAAQRAFDAAVQEERLKRLQRALP
jgi:hypothetical protein